MKEVATRHEFERRYRREMDEAMDSPGATIVCHQRYTLRERIAKFLGGITFIPKHPRLTVS